MGKKKGGNGGGGNGNGGEGGENKEGEPKVNEAEEKKKLMEAIETKTIKLDAFDNLATAMSCLGNVNTKLVALTQLQETNKALIEHHEKEKNKLKQDLEKEKKPQRRAGDKRSPGKAEISQLEEKLSFHKALLTAHPRAAAHHPALIPALVGRILRQRDFSRNELSTLSLVNKVWREACQAIIHARFVNLIIESRNQSDAYAELFKRSPSLGNIVRSISMSFHAAVFGGAAPRDAVPVSLVAVIAASKKATAVHFRSLATVAATRHVLSPLADTLEEVTIDTEDYARYAPKLIDFTHDPAGVKHPGPGLFSGWKKLKILTLRRVQLDIYSEQPSLCPLVQLTLHNCQVSGSLLYMLASSTQTLKHLWLVSCAGLSLEEVMEVMEVVAAHLTNLKLLGNRFAAAKDLERSFDQVIAGCAALENLSLDLSLPISSPEVLLAHQPALQAVEICRQEEQLEFEIWRTLFGAVSKKLKVISIVGTPWMPHEIMMLKDEWRWLGAECHFATQRPRYR